MKSFLLFLILLAGVFCSGRDAKAQAIILPCVPSGNSCIPVSAANPLPTTGGGIPSATCSTANGILFNLTLAINCDTGLTYAGSGGVVTQTHSGIGVTSTDGYLLQNLTAAAAGAQQWSPRLHFTGQGWKTNTTASSETVDWIMELQPIQGAATPGFVFAMSSQVNGAGYLQAFSINVGGAGALRNFTVGGSGQVIDLLPANDGGQTLGSAAARWASIFGFGNLTLNGAASTVSTVNATAAGTITNAGIASDATHTDTTVCQDTTSHVYLFGSGTAGICLGNVSSIRFKEAWKPLDDGLGVIMALKPGTWRYRPGIADGGARLQVGFLAEDYAEVLPDWTRYDAEGRPNGDDILAVLPQAVRAIQQLSDKFEEYKRTHP